MSTAHKYQPLGKSEVSLKLQFKTVAWTTVSLPLGSFLFCVFWSLYSNFQEATSTHCGVKNYLPSISAAIGTFSPQRYVWRVAIALHAAPRLMVAAMYYKYMKSVLYEWSYIVARMACLLNIAENLSLIGLTYVSSSENYAAHEKCFITFMVTSEIYMMVMCYLLKYNRYIPPNAVESRSLQMKGKLMATNIISFCLAGYFFVRHNWYCEHGIYTCFAFCEYVVVLTNMAYHMTAYWDFYDRELLIGPKGLKFS